ncbi:TetR-like C-terminal domain-containing protein [Bacillus sp. NEB1478]|uniref:TetR-like C-terminal domain-containing protein n=1 Tax=Bacillus sp. NEB1478 TaxID=3073816 RepID=UPI002872B03B|nr:TetR-like C-terminal domain-containing protein [Bacillus sp. NEB1478]WNB93781.1 TetR-like C-terminal domain-containing protein [Bacillus sp. NEB1478]
MSPRIGLDSKTVVMTAAKIADERGVDQVTLASLARTLKIRTPSLYNHIDGLEGLKRKLAIYGLKELRIKLQKNISEKDKEETIRSLAEAYIQFARSRPGLYELILPAADLNDPDIHQEGKALVDILIGVFRDYDLKEDAALHAVRGFRSVLHGFVSLEQKGGYGLPLDLDVTLKLLISSFIKGIPVFQQNDSE